MPRPNQPGSINWERVQNIVIRPSEINTTQHNHRHALKQMRGFGGKKKEQMKRAIKTWILKNYPPIVLTILIMMGFVAMCALLSVIEHFTTDLPIQYQ